MTGSRVCGLAWIYGVGGKWLYWLIFRLYGWLRRLSERLLSRMLNRWISRLLNRLINRLLNRLLNR